MQTLPASPEHGAPRATSADRRTPPASILARYLLGNEAAHPDLSTLRAFGLSGNAFARLPSHPERHALRADFRYASARHLATRAALAPLLLAWQEASIEAMVFKGFQLAEFVYESPGLRLYADVDILVNESQAALACEGARRIGWRVEWRASTDDDLRATHGSEYLGHEAAYLYHPTADVTVDLHRRVVHNNHHRRPASATATRLSEAVMASAVAAHVDGAPVLIAQPVDALVVGLALNRCWGSDDWQIKPRDYADFEALIGRYGLDEDAIMARSRELAVSRTVQTYLSRCHPGQRRLLLGEPGWWTRRWWNLSATPERGQRDLERLPLEADGFARDALAFARMLPRVRSARRRLELGCWDEADERTRGAPSVGPQEWRRIRRGIQRALKVLRVPCDEREAVGALAAYRVLRQRGVDVQLAVDSPQEQEPVPGPRLLFRKEPLPVTVVTHNKRGAD